MKSKEEILHKRTGHVSDELICVVWRTEDVYIAMQEYADQFTPKKESKSIEERKEEFGDSLMSISLGSTTSEFFDYWTEISPNAKKMRFEKEKVFDIKKRLERWNKNQKTFNNGNKPTTTTDDAIRSFITE